MIKPAECSIRQLFDIYWDDVKASAFTISKKYYHNDEARSVADEMTQSLALYLLEKEAELNKRESFHAFKYAHTWLSSMAKRDITEQLKGKPSNYGRSKSFDELDKTQNDLNDDFEFQFDNEFEPSISGVRYSAHQTRCLLAIRSVIENGLNDNESKLLDMWDNNIPTKKNMHWKKRLQATESLRDRCRQAYNDMILNDKIAKVGDKMYLVGDGGDVEELDEKEKALIRKLGFKPKENKTKQ